MVPADMSWESDVALKYEIGYCVSFCCSRFISLCWNVNVTSYFLFLVLNYQI